MTVIMTANTSSPLAFHLSQLKASFSVSSSSATTTNKSSNSSTTTSSHGLERQIRGVHRGGGKIHTVGWNADGRRLASGSTDHTVRIMDVERIYISTRQESWFTHAPLPHQGDVDQLAWHPLHPALLATASVDRAVRVWDTRTPCTSGPARHIPTAGENINICWSPDGGRIAAGNKTDLVTIIDFAAAAAPNSLTNGGAPLPSSILHTLQSEVEVNEIAYNYPGDLFCMSTGKGTVRLLDSTSFQLVAELATNTTNCYCLEMDPSGRWMATGGADAIVSIWEVDEWTQVRTIAGFDCPVRSLSFSHDGELIARGSEDPKIDIHHVETGELVHSIPVNLTLNSLAWSPNKYLLAYVGDEVDRYGKSSDGSIRLYGLNRMYIRQIIIQGFKSYKDQLVMEPFSPGHNVVVGRNGSGKSNFFWAIRFVLGDAYTNMTREERLSLLHEGTGPTTLSAFVEIIFDNAENRFPTGRSELTLRRTIGQKKDEYSLDKKSITKTEVMNLLESAGFSRSNPYYIVPQGRITALTNAKDAERLALLKEVAGTRVYEQKRTESVKIMEETDLKRQKINELLVTINDRLKELEAEKKELAEFHGLDRDRRCLEWAIHSQELKQVISAFDSLQHQEETALERSRMNQEDLDARLVSLRQIESETEELKQKLELLNVEFSQMDQERQEKNEQKAQLLLSIEEMESRDALVLQEKKHLQKQIRTIQSEISTKRAQLANMEPEFEKAAAAERSAEQAFNEAEVERETLRDKQGRQQQFRNRQERDSWLRQELQTLQDSLAEYDAQLASVETSRAELEARLASANKNLEASRTRLSSIRGDVDQAEQKISLSRAARNQLDERRKQLWRQDAKSAAHLESLRDQNAKARRALQSSVDRSTSLGLENVDKIARKFNLTGVYGPVYQLFSANPIYENAIEVVAGASLFHVVVDTDETASKLLSYLTKERLGRVTCMPLNRLNPRTMVYPDSEDVTPLISNLAFDSQYTKAFQQIFGKALVCRDLNTAATMARTSGCNAVTLDGDRADSKGALTGGYTDHKSSRLELVRRLSASESAMREEEETSTATKAELNLIDQHIIEARDEMSLWDAKKRAILASKDPLTQQVQSFINEIERCQESFEYKTQTHATLTQTIQSLRTKIPALERELKSPYSKSLSDRDQARLDQLNASMIGFGKELARCSEARVVIESQKATLESELEMNLERVLDTLQGKLDGLRDSSIDIDSRKMQVRKLEDDVSELADALKTLSTQIKENDATLQRDVKKEASLKAAYEEAQAAFENANLQAQKNISKKELLARKKEDISLSIRDLGAMPSDAEDYVSHSPTSLMDKLQKVKSKLKEYSHVNKKAVEQFTTFTKQKEGLNHRKTELDDSAKSIEELIGVLDTRKEEAIERTYQQVAKNFSSVWERLVPSGAGELVMVRRNINAEPGSSQSASQSDIATGTTKDQYVGVSISVSFLSKYDKGMVMSQLSGGQKSLVALAMIFAIQQCDPAPFYLFDEIDAALDSQYRASVANMVHELSRENAQFITTTFRPELLLHADKFYGVTFQNKVSRIQCITKEEATSFVEDSIGQTA